MEREPIEPLDTGHRIRRKGRRHRIRRWLRCVLRNRLLLTTVLCVAKAIVKIVRLISYLIDGS